MFLRNIFFALKESKLFCSYLLSLYYVYALDLFACRFFVSMLYLTFVFYKFCLFLAHLQRSRRLRSELIVYQSSRRPSVHASVCASVCSHFQT